MEYVVNVYAGSTTKGRHYNNPMTGETLKFNNIEDAEKFALRIEQGSKELHDKSTVWCEAVPYDPYKEKEDLFTHKYS
ncbi:hypothetical protein [Halobacillus litoralis]|uniref:hypothetical protein n=1 Tax=Halobacillus litoralis TaxID=45668 RepID=UPI001CD7B66A|nr:hypothetical protein [Halobacillus litoralis]MCA1021574.1 hypothetical protein [Halobacillus litoralis]